MNSAASPPTPPKATTVKEPKKEDVPISYKDYTGHRGQNGRTHLLHSDGSKAGIIGKTVGNIYLDAACNMQLSSDTCLHSAKTSLTQYFGKVEKNVKGTEDVHIGSNNTIKVDGERTINVVGKHTLNVAGPQETYLNSGQTIKVTGMQDVTVTADQTVTVGANQTKIVNGNQIAKTTGVTNFTFVGDLLNTALSSITKVNASRSSGLTLSDKTVIAVSDEASLNIGISEKINIGAHAEQNLSAKSSINCGSITLNNVGPKKELKPTEVAKGITSKTKVAMKSVAASYMKYCADMYRMTGKGVFFM